MSGHTRTPWSHGARGTSEVILNGLQSPELVIARLDSYPNHMANAARIVHCVNNHDALVEALEQAAIELDEAANLLDSNYPQTAGLMRTAAIAKRATLAAANHVEIPHA